VFLIAKLAAQRDSNERPLGTVVWVGLLAGSEEQQFKWLLCRTGDGLFMAGHCRCAL